MTDKNNPPAAQQVRELPCGAVDGALPMPQCVLDFDQFLNEPPSYEASRTVRDYRHDAYRKWSPVVTEIQRLLAARASAPAAPPPTSEVLLEACAPYLKDGETPAECIERNRKDAALVFNYYTDAQRWRVVLDQWDEIAELRFPKADGTHPSWARRNDPEALTAYVDKLRAAPPPMAAGQGEPVAWKITRAKKVYGVDLRESFGEFYAGTEAVADEYAAKGWTVTPLYASPEPTNGEAAQESDNQSRSREWQQVENLVCAVWAECDKLEITHPQARAILTRMGLLATGTSLYCVLMLALDLAIDALDKSPPTGDGWPVNWPVVVHDLRQLRAQLPTEGA